MNLIGSIEHAFDWRNRPDLLTGPNELSSDEREAVERIGAHTWKKITADQWERDFDAVSWLSPLAFCYYLPSIFKVSIEENNPNIIVASTIISMLDRSPCPEWWDDYFSSRWCRLNVRECEVVKEWLFWLSSAEVSSHSDDSLERCLVTVDLITSTNNSATSNIHDDV